MELMLVSPLSVLATLSSSSTVELLPRVTATSRKRHTLAAMRSTCFLTVDDNRKYITGSRQLLNAENSKAISLVLSATPLQKQDVSVIWVLM